MGQILLPDNIPTPVVASTTTLTLAATNFGAPTTMTVGGQQYTVSSILTLNTATTGANALDAGALGAGQLWYIYAIANSSTFAPAVIASLTVPSSGPTIPGGYYSAYKLVGAFYTNGSSQVGAIAPIVGAVVTEWMSYSPTFSAGFGTLLTNIANWRRNGDMFETRGVSRAGTVAASSASINIPFSLSSDGSKLEASASSKLGTYTPQEGATTSIATDTTGGHIYYNVGAMQWGSSNNSGSYVNANVSAILSTNEWFNWEYKTPIVGWKATLL